MRQLPNLLTIARLLLTPAIAYAIVQDRCRLAVLLTVIAGATDAADGYFARRVGAVTTAGTYLDPIADKILLTSLYIAFGAAGFAPWWLMWLVVLRDVWILAMAGGGFFRFGIREFLPSFWGKLSTVIQIAAAVVILGGCLWPLLQALRPLAIWVTAAATTWSGLHYTWRAVRVARNASALN